MTSASTLMLTNLSKRFDGMQLLDRVTVQFFPHEITCLCGENGIGKTTLFDNITGLVRPDSGSVIYQDQPIHGLSPAAIARLGIGRLFQHEAVFDALTVLENVAVAAPEQPGERWWTAPIWPLVGRRAEADNKHTSRQLLERFHLADASEERAGDLSGGQKRLVALARVLNSGARCLLLDEPTAGISVQLVPVVLEIIREVANAGALVIVIEHDFDAIETIANHVYTLSQGTLHKSNCTSDFLE